MILLATFREVLPVTLGADILMGCERENELI